LFGAAEDSGGQLAGGAGVSGDFGSQVVGGAAAAGGFGEQVAGGAGAGDSGGHTPGGAAAAGEFWATPGVDPVPREKARKGRQGKRGGRKGTRRGWLPDGPDAGSRADATPPADPEAVARAICLRLLTMAPRTRAQLAEAMRKRDVPDDVAESVLDRFTELGFINDEAFAEAWVESRHHGRGLAKRALASELRHRGVDQETVKEAVERLDPDQEAETARRLVEKKLPSTRGLDPKVRTRRLAGMLARKGYPAGLAFRVIKEALEQEGVEIEEEYP